MYIPQIYQLQDAAGNYRDVSVHADGNGFTASIRGGVAIKMASGNFRQPIVAIGTASDPLEAARCAIDNWAARSITP